ncbi:hypothetical protein NQ839_00930 [Acinetobacter baumannii]|nr:hypothetical protein [Acinetobacter baumannii]
MKLLLIKIAMNLIVIALVEVIVVGGGFLWVLGDNDTDEFIRAMAFILGAVTGACTFGAIGQSVSEYVDKEFGAKQ